MQILVIFALLIGSFSLSANEVLDYSDDRIVGGETVTIEHYPYLALLLVDDYPFCGGTVIHKLVILTAAHCLVKYLQQNINIRLGSSFNTEGGVLRKVDEIFIHPNYTTNGLDYDIALIKLDKPLDFSDKIAPATLPELNRQENSVQDLVGEIPGWGAIQENGPGSHDLQMVKLPTLAQNVCQSMYPKQSISARMFCAGYVEGGKDACQGDSGGPFIVDGHVLGITSWGKGCASKGQPGVYTRVSYFIDFINSTISGCCK